MDLNDAEKSALAASQAEAKAIAPQMVDAFYERLLAYENTAEYLTGKTDKLRVSLQDWFVQLFAGDYGADYVRSRLAIGEMHVRIGLPVRYPLAMMDIILEFGEKVAAASPQADTAKVAIRKLLALDIAIFNQAYEDTQLEHLAETVGNERLARRILTK
jgi:hypothetical protein